MQATRLFTAVLVFFFISASAGLLEAQTITHVPLYTFDGDSGSALFGFSVSGAGDVNGDGTPDLIVGAPSSERGSVRVLSGSDGSALYNFTGDSSDDGFGFSVSGAGDVDGDGFADLVVGVPSDNDGIGNNIGSARVLSGSDGSVLYNFTGEVSGDQFGRTVSGAGDLNGDGTPDLIVGGRGRISNNGGGSATTNGRARVLSGSDGSVLYNLVGDPANDNDAFGRSVSGAGDVNGDGTPDLIVGDWLNGSARVLSGSDGSVLYTFSGERGGDRFGISVSGAGDVNGDGLADLIVGAQLDDNGGEDPFAYIGSAYVLSGSDGSVLYNFEGDNADDYFGHSVSGAGDVNGDGFDDLIVGTNINLLGFTSGTGIARVLSGSDGSVLYNFFGDSEGDDFGRSVSCAGDLNGDGLDDFIVGAIRGGANGGGYARVFVSQISPSPLLGDVDLSGNVDFLDINPFISVLTSGTYQREADMNTDERVTFLDIAPFIVALTGQ